MKHWTALAAAGFIAAAAFVPANAADISGAGATFPYPIYAKWADAYKKVTGNGLNYQSIGSGGGIKQITARTVTFGASDMPLQPAELDKIGVIQFPTVMGGIVPVVNLDGIKSGELTIDGPTLARIFLGEITKWDDPALKKLNPNAKLPSQAIALVHRSDGSGTTFIFTNYLSKVSEGWKSKVGSNTSVEWPAGIGAKGNEGVANNVGQTKGSIGYVETAYAKQNHLTTTKMVNKDGQTVEATPDAIMAAASWRRLGACAWLLHDPDRLAGCQVLADRRCNLHPGAEAAEGSGRDQGSAQVLRMGLQERRRDGFRAGLHPDAGQCRRPDCQPNGRATSRTIVVSRSTKTGVVGKRRPPAPFPCPPLMNTWLVLRPTGRLSGSPDVRLVRGRAGCSLRGGDPWLM